MKFAKLIDIGELQELCEGFTALTGAVIAVLDLEGNILTATGCRISVPVFTGSIL